MRGVACVCEYVFVQAALLAFWQDRSRISLLLMAVQGAITIVALLFSRAAIVRDWHPLAIAAVPVIYVYPVLIDVHPASGCAPEAVAAGCAEPRHRAGSFTRNCRSAAPSGCCRRTAASLLRGVPVSPASHLRRLYPLPRWLPAGLLQRAQSGGVHRGARGADLPAAARREIAVARGRLPQLSRARAVPPLSGLCSEALVQFRREHLVRDGRRCFAGVPMSGRRSGFAPWCSASAAWSSFSVGRSSGSSTGTRYRRTPGLVWDFFAFWADARMAHARPAMELYDLGLLHTWQPGLGMGPASIIPRIRRTSLLLLWPFGWLPLGSLTCLDGRDAGAFRLGGGRDLFQAAAVRAGRHRSAATGIAIALDNAASCCGAAGRLGCGSRTAGRRSVGS